MLSITDPTIPSEHSRTVPCLVHLSKAEVQSILQRRRACDVHMIAFQSEITAMPAILLTSIGCDWSFSISWPEGDLVVAHAVLSLSFDEVVYGCVVAIKNLLHSLELSTLSERQFKSQFDIILSCNLKIEI